MTEPKIVYRARSSADATALQKWLEDAGIEARVNEGLKGGGALDFGVQTDPEVVVADEDYEAARQVVAQYEDELHRPTDMSEMSDAEGQFDWPFCPQCDELRHATCQACGHVGSDFRAGDSDGGDQAESLCLTCGKPTRIVYLDTCKFCGHDFERESRSAAAAHADSTQMDTSRAMILVAGLVLVAVILVVWLIVSSG